MKSKWSALYHHYKVCVCEYYQEFILKKGGRVSSSHNSLYKCTVCKVWAINYWVLLFGINTYRKIQNLSIGVNGFVCSSLYVDIDIISFMWGKMFGCLRWTLGTLQLSLKSVAGTKVS